MLEMIYHSKIGPLLLRSDGTYLTGVHFLMEVERELPFIDLPIFRQTVQWLDLYFAGKEPDFMPSYKIENSTPFRKRVLEILTTIPYGKTTTYKSIAEQIAKEWGLKRMSSQAVGGAVGWNPIGILIPCHRVLGANYALTGYAGGLEHKVELLTLEGIDEKTLIYPKDWKKMTK